MRPFRDASALLERIERLEEENASLRARVERAEKAEAELRRLRRGAYGTRVLRGFGAILILTAMAIGIGAVSVALQLC